MRDAEWQKPTQHCKAIIFQLKITFNVKNLKKKASNNKDYLEIGFELRLLISPVNSQKTELWKTSAKEGKDTKGQTPPEVIKMWTYWGPR